MEKELEKSLINLTIEHQKHHLPLVDALNVRDLGGYISNSGHKTRWHRLIRAGNLDQLSPVSQQSLIDYGVELVIDLRAKWEVEKFPNVFANSKRVHYQNLPLYSEEVIVRLNEPATLAELNYLVLELCQPQIKAILTAVTESNYSKVLIIHCSAGKDRTGLVIALLLSLVGVTPQIVAEDYSLSAYYLADKIKQWQEQAQERGQNLARFEADMASDPQTILKTLSYLKQTYVSVDRYVEKLGFNTFKLKQLKYSLLE
jgi:protein-tyrosine phosphatase